MPDNPTNPRLAVITLEDLAQPTGQSQRLLALLPHLGRHFRISLVSRTACLPADLEGVVESCRRLPVPSGVRPIRWFLHPFGPWRLARLRGSLARLPAEGDVLYTDSVLLADMMGARPEARKVAEVNGVIAEEFRSRRVPLGQPLQHWLAGWERRAWTRPNELIAVSPGLAEYIRGQTAPNDHAEQRINVVGNGIDPSRFHAGIDGGPIRQENGWGERPIGFFHGWFRGYHGVENLIRTLPPILARKPDFLLLLVGDGPRRRPAEALVERMGLRRSVFFAGPQPPSVIARWISASDVCLYFPDYPAGSCGFLGDPIKFYEYMAVGRPIVTVDLPGLGAPVLSAGAGIAVPPDFEKFAEAVVELLNDPNRAQALGQAGAEAARRDHTWEAVADRVAAICLHGWREERIRR